MRCRKCDRTAVINMRQHKLALCKEHYLEWVPVQVEHTIRKYQLFTHQNRLLVAVSGGKDSLSLWDILHRLGYQADGLYIGLGIDGGIDYSNRSLEYAHVFSQEHCLTLHVINIKALYGESIPELSLRTHRGHYKPCSVCGITKRHEMNRMALSGNYDVLLTGHNLDDEAAILLGNTLNWQAAYLLHQGPVLEADRPGLVRKAKPLCRMYEREMATYALLANILYVHEECPHAAGSTSIYHKQILNKLESDRPGTKLSFYLSYLQVKQAGLFSSQADNRADQIHSCPNCGQPTSAPGLCVFCRMFIGDGDKAPPDPPLDR
jgi:tRNA-5-methyluridine54 2-sulfurtransferase